jgi:hypothetical protein
MAEENTISGMDSQLEETIHSIEQISSQKKPIHLSLFLCPDARNNKSFYEELSALLAPYGGVLSPFRGFESVLGYEISDPNKAKQIIMDQRADKISYIRDIQINTEIAEVCDRYYL